MARATPPARLMEVGDDGAHTPGAPAMMNSQDGFDHTAAGGDRRASGPDGARATLDNALARCRSELEARVPDAITGEFSVGALASLREPIAEFASVASREKLPPERALVMFKRMIGQLTDIERCPVEQRDALHQQLVEMAIQSYYRGREEDASL